jgi:hypothetical protein
VGEALRDLEAHPRDVRDVMEYRVYEEAVRVKDHEEGGLAEHPELRDAYQELLAAQAAMRPGDGLS